ncbi:MupA/Atu3671 family FMN-dependent luciferase-like monooxygenase [Actinoplanes subtropicus]|uniref:MupA/Atu3671 family FMN-dependent luciferase-like monooxygenase n=1 Tax=Actinoplanes subtropicus TaxID=543632 RepID=UPI0004C39E6B|nr:MupA/Atu3671 family FMN-dependent luciferase-like monooxygenase [Actinoplanes subtropicus]
MDFSVFFFADDSAGDTGSGTASGTGRYDLLLQAARFADDAGFTAVWTPERHFHPMGGLYPNPSVTSAALAVVTRSIDLRAGSVVAPLHEPLRIAEEWSVVDNLSAGRTGVSFASGWSPQDFVLRPEAYGNRKPAMWTAIEEVRALWRGSAVVRIDGSGSDRTVRAFPRPVQPDLPIWISAAGDPATFARAGAEGFGILTHLLHQDLDALTRNIATYRAAAEEARRRGSVRAASKATDRVVLMLHTYLSDEPVATGGELRRAMSGYLRSSLSLGVQSAGSPGGGPMDEDDRDALVEAALERYLRSAGLFGTPDEAVSLVERLTGAGVDEIACLVDFGLSTQRVMESLARVHEVRERTTAVLQGGTTWS